MGNAMTSDSALRVTRSSRSLRLAVLLFAGCLAVITALRAQEPAPPPAETGAEETTESTDGTEGKTGPNAADEPAAGPDRKPAAVGPTPGRFEPTEKVRADFDVSFPVDI